MGFIKGSNETSQLTKMRTSGFSAMQRSVAKQFSTGSEVICGTDTHVLSFVLQRLRQLKVLRLLQALEITY